MEQALDTIGEHFVQATFFSEQFKKEFSFFVKVVLRQKKAKEAAAAKKDRKGGAPTSEAAS